MVQRYGRIPQRSRVRNTSASTIDMSAAVADKPQRPAGQVFRFRWSRFMARGVRTQRALLADKDRWHAARGWIHIPDVVSRRRLTIRHENGIKSVNRSGCWREIVSGMDSGDRHLRAVPWLASELGWPA